MTIVVSYDKYQEACQSVHTVHASLASLLQAGPEVLMNVNKWTVKAQAVRTLDALGSILLFGMQTATLAAKDPTYGIHDAMLAKFNDTAPELLKKLKDIFSLCEQVLEDVDLGDMAQAKATLDYFSNMSKAKA